MLVSMNWIQDFVDLSGHDIDNLIHRFTLSTAEVEDVIHKGADTNGVIVAEIVSIENHPDSKKLHLLKINTGSDIRDCVCGAPNVRVGMKVAFAQVGGSVCGNPIGKAKIAGFESEGMCCSEAELGISDDHSGLMEIFDDASLGTDIKSLYAIDDIIFEVDNKSLTNRPDLWGHYGIAREFAALVGAPLQVPAMVDVSKYNDLPALSIKVDEPDLCYRYCGIRVENVTGKVSPVNMRIRLFYCGMRGINLLADLTNYIMLELGQPMHAFDADVVKNIVVRKFDNEFIFKTLDDTDRTITPEMLMICNEDTPVGIAGVMGGFDSEITDNTTNLTLESANFNGVSIRKTSTALALRTDASMRYEKMLDPEVCLMATQRFLHLLMECDPGVKVVSSLTDIYVKHYDTITLSFNMAYVDRYTGIEISEEKVAGTLTSLGFAVEHENGEFTVTVPSWRATKDVTIKADIIEEITRIYGYDNFEIKTTKSPLYPVNMPVEKRNDYTTKDILVQRFNYHEVHSYIWPNTKKCKDLGIEIEPNVSILNSIDTAGSVLRNSMIPTLLCMVNENKSYASDFGIFEIGKVINGLNAEGMCDERKILGMVKFSKVMDEKTLFYDFKNTLTELILNLKSKEPKFVRTTETTHAWQHPKNTIKIYVDDVEVGYFAVLHPTNLAKLDKKAAVMFCEINMDVLEPLGAASVVYDEPSKYPGIDFDLSITMGEGSLYGDIVDACYSVGSQLLKSVKLYDQYRTETENTLTVRLNFTSSERTLSMEEVQKEVNDILAVIESKGMKLKQ